jgi:endonuclease/exonuclease/phosphatase family metal-dependent hydrolase
MQPGCARHCLAGGPDATEPDGMRIRLVVALLATLVSLLAGTPARAGGPPMLTMTFNACGNVCRHGEVDLTTANIAYQIRARRVAVAMLQELCYSQFLGVRERLARYGYSAIFATGAKGGHCADYDRAHGRAFGVALIARGRLTGGVAHRLVSPSVVRPEPRMVLGATVRLAGRTLFAVTTHTSPSGPNLAWQMNAIDRWLTPAAASRPVLFGGDLNSQPDNADLNGFYASFTEADGGRTGPLPTFITVPRKIDYLFGSRDYLSRRGASTACGAYSDHCMYFGLFE